MTAIDPDAALEQLAADLVFDVLELEMPVPSNPTPSGGSGYYWKIGDQLAHDNAEPLELALAFFWDLWRRCQVSRLVEERGLPAELVQLVWDRLPYESVMFRHGWEEWARRRDAARASATTAAHSRGAREG